MLQIKLLGLGCTSIWLVTLNLFAIFGVLAFSLWMLNRRSESLAAN